MPDYTYVGPARLTVATAGGPQPFRGRVLRHAATGALRFYVNRLPSGGLPPGWPHAAEWADVGDAAALEWTGKKADDIP